MQGVIGTAAPGMGIYLYFLASGTVLGNGSDLDNRCLLLTRFSHLTSNCTSLDREEVFL